MSVWGALAGGLRRHAGADHGAAGGQRAGPHPDRPALPARHRPDLRSRARQGTRLPAAPGRRRGVRARLLRDLRRDRHERLAARSAARTTPRDRLRHGARQHPAARRPPPHGQRAQRRRQQPAARAARLPAAQLRPRHARSPPCSPTSPTVRSSAGLPRSPGSPKGIAARASRPLAAAGISRRGRRWGDG